MISFIGMLAAMVSMALAACSLALAVVVYRRTRGSATSRQECQEPVQASPAAGTPAAAVAAGGGAVDGATGRLLITPCWFSRLMVPLAVWSARLVVSCLRVVGEHGDECPPVNEQMSCLRVVGEQLLSSRVPVVCWPCVGQCRGSLLVMRRLVRLLPLVAAWAGWCLAPCRVVGRGPPARNAHFLSLLAAATPPINQKTGG